MKKAFSRGRFLYIVTVYSEEKTILEMVKFCSITISTYKMEARKGVRGSTLYVLMSRFRVLKKNYNAVHVFVPTS